MESTVYHDAPFNASRSQLLRRLSGHSHNGSPGSKRGAARVAKPNGASHSPHSMQRRRTTASQSARTSHVAAQDHAFLIQEPCMLNYGDARRSTHTMRPVSWHPGFGAAGNLALPENGVTPYRTNFHQGKDRLTTRRGPDSEVSTGVHPSSNRESVISSRSDYRHSSNVGTSSSDRTLGNTIAGFETLAVSGSSRQSFESDLHHVAVQNQHSLNQLQAFCHQSFGAGTDWSYLEPDSGVSFPSYSNYHVCNGYQPQSMQCPSSYDAYALAQGSVFPSSEYAIYAAPTSPDFLPIQFPADVPPEDNTRGPPQMVAKRSKELIGMGLYDDKNGSMFASLDYIGSGASGLGDSLGKGLKLEETWKPPGDAEAQSDEADEGYSTDDVEEDLPVCPAPQEAQTQVFPVYDDMSNQTFFFENDEEYSNCVAFDQGMSAYQAKCRDPGNSLWF